MPRWFISTRLICIICGIPVRRRVFGGTISGMQPEMGRLRSIGLVSLLLCSSFAAWAADVTGTWTARVPSPPLWDAWTLNFNVDGDKLSGTISDRRGNLAITDGKISGDTLSFTVKAGYGRNSVEQKYMGAVSGGEIKFRREGQFRNPPNFSTANTHSPRTWSPAIEFTARQVTSLKRQP
jgi:hypothetical protein